MTWRQCGVLAVGALGLGLVPGVASAQLFGGGAPMPPSGGAAIVNTVQSSPSNMGLGMAMYSNPYTNAMMNPFMNPYLTQMSPNMSGNTGNAALYFMAAQQMNGGLGSGKIGGPRAVGAAAKPAPVQPDLSRGTGSNTPGATASRYFGRSTPKQAGASRYYGRPSSHYPNNGR